MAKKMNTKNTIINLLESTGRVGRASLIVYLVESGFFEAPASLKVHGARQGGLAEHSVGVYVLLTEQVQKLKLGEATSPGQKPLEFDQSNIIIAALLHDVCKIGSAIGTEAPYKWNKAQPKGHAILSIERIKAHIELAPIEEMMIRYHMGVYGLCEFHEEGSWSYKTQAEYHLRGDHSNDANMTKEESQEARYGESLANAWFHNPVVKMIYLCDELATLSEKADS